jgi:hypothetical protein
MLRELLGKAELGEGARLVDVLLKLDTTIEIPELRGKLLEVEAGCTGVPENIGCAPEDVEIGILVSAVDEAPVAETSTDDMDA